MDVSKALLEDITAFLHTISGAYIQVYRLLHWSSLSSHRLVASYSFSDKTNTLVASQEVDTKYS